MIEPVQILHPKGSAAALMQALTRLDPLTELIDAFPDVDHGLKALENVLL